MSFSIIGEKSYYKLLGDYDKKYKVIELQDNSIIYKKITSNLSKFGRKYYAMFSSGELFVIYILETGSIRLFVNKKFDADDVEYKINNEDFSLDNWKITKINDQTPYIRNEYLRYNSWQYDEDIEDGQYLLEDSIEEKELISLKKLKGEYDFDSEIGIVFQDKLLPNSSSRISELKDKTNFYELIFNEYRKRNRKINKTS